MSDWSVEFYCRDDGSSPVFDWYEAQDDKTRAKLLRTFQLLETNGIDLGEPYIKPLGDKLFEVRAQVNRKAIRVICFLYTGRRFVLLHGFQKKTQKTPEKELSKARKCFEDFLERNSVDEPPLEN
jgi:phage-related protein